jgi:hypothetical protein
MCIINEQIKCGIPIHWNITGKSKRNDVPMHATKWINLKKDARERRQKRKTKYCYDSSYMKLPEQTNG